MPGDERSLVKVGEITATDSFPDVKGYSANAATPADELMVTELEVNSELFPGAKAYSGTLTNTTAQSIRLEAIHMP